MADINVENLNQDERRKLFSELLEVLPVDDVAESIRMTLLTHEVQKIKEAL